MYLDDLRNSLVDLARHRVSSGKVTERGLAKACGLSQPHMHHVLKKVRSLSIESADRLLVALQITATDLILRFPFGEDLGTRAVPILRTRIGPGITPNFNVYGGFLGIPAYLTANLVDPVLARVAPDLSLPPTILADDILLLDQNAAVRTVPVSGAPYVLVDRDSSQIRYLWLSGNRVYLSDAQNRPPDAQNRPDLKNWQSLPLQGKAILDSVRARIVWISREIGKKPQGSFEPAGESD